MDAVINVAAGALVMFVFVWVLIFGGIGALLSNARDGSSLVGMAWGTALGPIGWAAILWRTRAVAPGHLPDLAPAQPALLENPAGRPADNGVHDY
jgi:hypothetical protein